MTMDRSFSFLLLVLQVIRTTHAALTPLEYWKTVLPATTPVPAAVQDLFNPDVTVRIDGLAGAEDRVVKDQFSYQRAYGTGVSTRDNLEGLSKDETFFFLEKDLHPGAKLKQRFARGAPATAFIPRGAADSIPFSSHGLSDILSRFSVPPSSPAAKTIRETLLDCESKQSAEESKLCATSLESMVDFTTSALGTRDVLAVSAEVTKPMGAAILQEYVVASSPPMQELAGGTAVICHQQPYPYAVFYCHLVKGGTRAYVVPLVGGKDGAEVNALAVCHLDTSTWNPRHLAFQILKMKPGKVPICHFINVGDILWVPRRR